MLQAFMIVLREGIEAFLVVAITFAYLRKTAQNRLMIAVWWGVLASLLASALLGFWLWENQGAQQPLWEGILGLVTTFLVATLVVHMRRVGPHLKKDMETELSCVIENPRAAAYWGVFFFTIVMVAREGMEMALLLFQIRDPQIVTGIVGGILAAALIAWLWQQFGYMINLGKFFQITTIFLLLFIVQIAVQAFHEFTEAGIFPNSEALHKATEPFSTSGIYGKWYGNVIFFTCAGWLILSLFLEKTAKSKKILPEATPGH